MRKKELKKQIEELKKELEVVQTDYFKLISKAQLIKHKNQSLIWISIHENRDDEKELYNKTKKLIEAYWDPSIKIGDTYEKICKNKL